jgi:hypothetical protein
MHTLCQLLACAWQAQSMQGPEERDTPHVENWGQSHNQQNRKKNTKG